MKTDQKKKLLADVKNALHALGQILDGGHDIGQLRTFNKRWAATLKDQSLGALCGLGLLEAWLEAEIEEPENND